MVHRLLGLLVIVMVSCVVCLLLKVLPRHYMILLRRYALILKEVTEDTLKVNHDHWVVQLVRAPTKIVTECAFEEFLSLWVKLSFNIFVLDLLLLVWNWFLSMGYLRLS